MSKQREYPERATDSHLLPTIELGSTLQGISFVDLLRLIWRRRFVILGCSLLLSALGVLYLYSRPNVYEATATVIVAPPTFSTELKPPTLSVEAYQAISESPAILARVLEKAPAEQASSLLLTTQIKLGRARNSTPLPLLDLTVRAPSPGLAQSAANLWAQTIVAESSELAERGRHGTLQFIEEQFPEVAQMLSKKEVALKDRQNHFDKATLTAKTQWDQRVLDYQNETERLASEHTQETERLLLEFKNQAAAQIADYEKTTERLRLELLDRTQPELKTKELRVKEGKLAEFQGELADAQLHIKSLQVKLEQLEKEIRKHPDLLVISKAITDEALWEQVAAKASKGLPDALNQLKMRTEVVNPVHTRLLEQLADARVDRDSYLPRRDHLLEVIAALRADIDTLTNRITEAEIELADLTKTRELGLEVLKSTIESNRRSLIAKRSTSLKILNAERELGESELEANRTLALETIEREAGVELARLSRETKSAQSTYDVLASKYESALLAKSEQDPDLKIGTWAQVPRGPVRRELWIKSALVVLIAFLATLGSVIAVELARELSAEAPARPASDSARQITPSTRQAS